MRLSLGCLCLVALLATLAPAQEVTGNVLGTISDPTGAVVPSAKVVLTNITTKWTRETTSAQDGSYQFNLVPIGRYQVEAETSGFKKVVTNDFVLNVNAKLRVDVALQVGQITESVEVVAAVATVQTQEGVIAEVLDSTHINDVPLNGRQYSKLLTLMPGTYSFVSTDPTTTNAFEMTQIAVNGLRPTHTNWLVDGSYIVDTGGNWGIIMQPSLEAVSEVKMLRANYSAEFGLAGAGQVNAITKSGTPDFHGVLYNYLRNDKLDANDFFQNRAGQPRRIVRFNDFGYTLGGPVWIPKVYNRHRNRTFFFWSMEWSRIRIGRSSLATVPTERMRNGDFGELLPGLQLKDPTSGAPFAGNAIPANRINDNAKKLLTLFPSQNTPGLTRNFALSPTEKQDRHQYLVKIDHRFNDRHTMFTRYSHDWIDQLQVASFPGFQRVFQRPTPAFVATLNSTFTPTFLNEFSFNRYSEHRPNRPLGDFSPQRFGVNFKELYPNTKETYPEQYLGPLVQQIPNSVGFTRTYTGWSVGTAGTNYEYITEFRDNLVKIQGPHTLKFGFLFQKERKFEPADTGIFGSYTFSGLQSGEPFADYLLGLPDQYDESSSVSFNESNRWTFETYFNDTWRVSRKLTLNLGIRYSLYQVPYETTDRFRMFWKEDYDFKKAVKVDPVRGFLVPGSGDPLNGITNPDGRWNTDKNNFAPRASFAYDLFGNGKTSLKGGFGLFHSREILGGFILITSNPPLQNRASLFAPGLVFGDPTAGRPSTTTNPVALSTIQRKQLVPYTEQWNFGLQREIVRGTVVDLSYVGNHGLHFMRSQDINQGLPSVDAANRRVSLNALRPYPGYAAITSRDQDYSSMFHSLQMSLTRNFSRGLSAQMSYTWGKAIDTGNYSGNIYGARVNTYDASTERGRASFDVRHNFVASYVYELPFFNGRRNLVERLLGHWQISGITAFRSGAPDDIFTGQDIAGTGAGSQRGILTRNPNLPKGQRTLERMFDTSAAVLPALGTLAQTGRNTINGLGTNNWDIALFKDFVIKEQRQVELRFETFNTFNHTQLAGFSTTMNSPLFGQATSARTPRNAQASLKFRF